MRERFTAVMNNPSPFSVKNYKKEVI